MEDLIMANREEQLKQITEQLEQGVAEIFTSEKYTEYLNTMAKFHNYSFNNTLLIAMQKPEATLVAGYQAWQKKFNRQVKRGEKGIQIIAPAPFKEKQEIEKTDPETGEIVIGEDGQPETEVVERVITKFRVTTVFDVSQTTGEPIPEFEVSELEGDVLIYHDFMGALKTVAPVPIRFIEIDGEAKGFYQLVRQIFRVAGHKSDPFYAVDSGKHVNKIRKISGGTACRLSFVRIDILTEQRYFPDSVGGKRAHFPVYIFRPAASLPASCIRHDAIAAEVIAAVHYIDKAPVTVKSFGRQSFRYTAVGPHVKLFFFFRI